MTKYSATPNKGHGQIHEFDDAQACADFIQIDVNEMLWAITEEGICETEEWTVSEDNLDDEPSDDADFVAENEDDAKTVWAELNPKLIAGASQDDIETLWFEQIEMWSNTLYIAQEDAQVRVIKHWINHPLANAILGR